MATKQCLRGVIFDFDQTLFDTSHLREARDSGNWEYVKSQISTIHPFDGVIDCLKRLRAKGYKIAVVTNSPGEIPEKVFRKYDITIDGILGYGSTDRHKPHPDPMLKGAAVLKLHPSRCVAIGDRCIDIAAAKAAGMESMGAEWYVPTGDFFGFKRDLVTARPNYLATSPRQVAEILEERFDQVDGELALSEVSATSKRVAREFWKIDLSPSLNRLYLTDSDKYFYARCRYSGSFSESYANHLISNLKIAGTPQNTHSRWKFKVDAVKQCVEEMSWVLPRESTILIISGSKLQYHQDYDWRVEMLNDGFAKHRPDLKNVCPIKARKSRDAVHTVDDSSLRDPKEIESNIEWVGTLPAETKSIYLLDDVITSGGHFKAYKNLINNNAPGVEVTGLFWTAQRNIRNGEG